MTDTERLDFLEKFSGPEGDDQVEIEIFPEHNSFNLEHVSDYPAGIQEEHEFTVVGNTLREAIDYAHQVWMLHKGES